MNETLEKKAEILAASLLEVCRAAGLRIATAESCTGGLLAAAITATPGASEVFDIGFVTYSNAAKTRTLGVSDATLREAGAVSRATAKEMSLGALHNSEADLAASVTGIAGPGGGSKQKPVGLVYFACARRGRSEVAATERQFGALTRDAIRAAAVIQALEMLLEEAARPRP